MGGGEAGLLRGGVVCVIIVGGRERGGGEFGAKDILQYPPPVVPYCVVFWVLYQQAGSGLEGVVGIVAGGDLC